MNFIYRIPLFDFDINNPVDVKNHRKQILSAIQLSSPSFSQKLSKHSFEDLDYETYLKLKKYLIRGRYRPTPFGEFAACGLANFGKIPSTVIQIETEEITSSKPISHREDNYTIFYQAVPGIHTFLDRYQGVIFDTKSQKWIQSSIPKNSLMDSILKKPINFEKFSEMFESAIPNSGLRSEIQSLWKELLESGFLSIKGSRKIPQPSFKKQDVGKDLYSKNKLEIDPAIESQLSNVVNEIGHLFQKEESKYLSDFKNWFSDKFDDRYCPLESLLSESEFISLTFSTENISHSPEAMFDFFNGIQNKKLHQSNSIDLQEIFEKSPLPDEIFDIQFLYRLDKNGRPIIENIVCNRPFVYHGRFSKVNPISHLGSEIKEKIFTDPSVIYATLELIESDTINHICDTKSSFKYQISPLPFDSPNNLKFSELYLGLESNRFFLIHQSGKQVCPIVLHPLNGSQITHPIMKLLWELAHQDRYRFKPFASPLFNQLSTKPRLYWNDTCLQAQKWVLKKNDPILPENLKKSLDEYAIPEHFLAGSQDQELLLQKNKKDDLDILYKELQKRRSLTISECPWIQSEVFQNEKKDNLYPQFVFQFSRKKNNNQARNPFNPINKPQINCLYLIIPCLPGKLEDLLCALFNSIKQFQTVNGQLEWFFLQYPKNKHTEIRLRVLNLTTTKKQNLTIQLLTQFEEEKLQWKMETYFPEKNKYGEESLNVSHQLFYMESLFLSQVNEHKEMNLELSEPVKLSTITQIWLPIFLQSDYKAEYFQKLKQLIKALGYKNKNQFQCELKKHQNSASKHLSLFPIERYHYLIQSHEFYLKGYKTQTQLLFNHLHMMVNRFFPTDTKLQEEKTWYFLYRELGEAMFGLRKSIQPSSH